MNPGVWGHSSNPYMLMFLETNKDGYLVEVSLFRSHHAFGVRMPQ